MLKTLLYLSLITLAVAQTNRPPVEVASTDQPEHDRRNLTLCTYANITYNKCLRTRMAADSNAIDLRLACVQKSSQKSCIQDVQQRLSDMVVLDAHDYQAARKQKLRPVLFANVTRTDYYVAVAPRSISLIDYFEAPLSLDLENDRAFHAAVFFNQLRGRDICPQPHARIADNVQINITSSAQYTSAADNLLICLFGGYNIEGDVAACNWDVGLQRAVFVPKSTKRRRISAIKELFDKIVKEFSVNAAANGFNFFDSFFGEDDVIFEHDTKSFDLKPTYINDINERTFNKIHCDKPDEEHNPDQVKSDGDDDDFAATSRQR